jgi:MoaA/NifB/PqqE/SkfB family radical SAM enzyme
MTPFSAYISVTDRCLLNCWHCSNANKEVSDDLALEDLSRIIKEVQDAGVSCIGFTGGEPALRNDLEQLISSVDSRSFTVLFTTGYGIDEDRAKVLRQAGLTAIIISLDSHIKEEHNQKRKSETAFDNALSAIRNSIQAGIYTVLSTVITKEILYTKKIYELIRYAARLGVAEIRILEPKPCGRLLDTSYESFDEQDRDRIRRFQYEINRDDTLPTVMSLAHMTSRDNYGCCAGRIYIYIGTGGEVCPCDFSPLSFGNLLKEPFHKVYARMNSYLPEPFCGCIISSVSKYLKEVGNNKLPIRDIEKIDHLLRSMEKGPIPQLFLKLGFKEA